MKYKLFKDEIFKTIIEIENISEIEQYYSLYNANSHEEYAEEDIEQEDILMDDEEKLEVFLNTIRQQRNILLKDSDFTQLSDSPLAAEAKTEWATYRQELRDFPETITTLEEAENPTWPEAPNV